MEFSKLPRVDRGIGNWSITYEDPRVIRQSGEYNIQRLIHFLASALKELAATWKAQYC
jgi:hypothetical protein